MVERPELPDGLQPLRIEPKPRDGDHPYFVKLRAEATPEALRGRKGKLYLGFHLDPLYGVHWNNLVDPVQFTIETAGDVAVSPAEGRGPKVEAAADVDPREFVVDIESGSDRDRPPLKVTVRYFACNDAEGWCLPLSQEYLVHLEPDRDGGRAMRNRGPGGRPTAPTGLQRRPAEVVSIDRESRTLRARFPDGRELNFVVPESTPINLDGRPGRLEDLRPGYRVMLGIDPGALDSDAPPIVHRMMARARP